MVGYGLVRVFIFTSGECSVSVRYTMDLYIPSSIYDIRITNFKTWSIL